MKVHRCAGTLGDNGLTLVRLTKYWAAVAILAAMYFVAARYGLRLAYVHPSATPIWPPTGIALAAMLVLGYRVWPGVLIGAFLANIMTAGTAATSLGIAIGNALEGVVGAYLVNRFAGGQKAFEKVQEVFKLAVWAGMVRTTVAARVEVAGFSPTVLASGAKFGRSWFTGGWGVVAG